MIQNCYQSIVETKEAFSDGVSSMDKSWYEIIQESLETREFNITSDITLNMEPKQTNKNIIMNYSLKNLINHV